MSARARAAATVRNVAASEPSRESRRQRRRRDERSAGNPAHAARAASAPDATVHHLARYTIVADTAQPQATPDVERDTTTSAPADLLDRAVAEPPRELPHRALLEARFGRSLAGIEVHTGPAARAALDALGATAATHGTTILFRDAEPDLETVAHEVVHVLQSGVPVERGTADDPAIVAADATAEREATRLSAAATTEGNAPLAVTGSLAPDAVALQRATLDVPSASEAAASDPGAAFTTAAAAAPAVGARAAEEAVAETPAAAPAPGTASAPASEPGVAPELPPALEPTVSVEDVAAREAALAEAEAILAAAQSSSGLVDAFASAPPTVKARQQVQLGGNLDRLAKQEAQEIQDDVPELHAELKTQAEPVEPVQVAAPEVAEVELEAEAPGPAPEPEIPETPDPGSFGANDDITRAFASWFPEEPAGRAEQIGESLADVQTTDPDIPRTPGPPPTVPLGGETDPQRIANQAGEGTDQARGATDDAQAAVLNGPGPEQVQPLTMDEAYRIEPLNQPQVTPPAPAEGADAYLAMNLPPEVQTAFDQQQQAAMETSMAGAREQAAQATTERDQARDAAVQHAEDEAERLSTTADASQRAKVGEARQTIQTERQATLDAQTQAVSDLEGDVEQRRSTDLGAIDDRVQADEAQIEDRYAGAERDAQAEIAKGERDAEREREKAEREAEDKSWWEKALDWVADAFNALVNAINKVFDAVRSLVNDILDAVKAFALELIDAVAGFIKDAIAAFGEFLKFAVDTLIGSVFPELAAKLNAAIDDAVAASQAFVDDVADDLKAGISALIEGLRAGINKALDVFQAAVNVAAGLIEAALTGDWSALARKALEAVLMVAGIAPETFYEFIGRAEETFQIIVDDPGGFLGNIFSTLVGGIQRFADNFLSHLQNGIITWLTGAIGGAGITIPPAFDLFGVLDIARQILGLTWERIRQKAVTLIGEENVERLELVYSYIETLVTGGWPALWERLSADLATLRDTVFDAIESYLTETIIFAAITKVASLFSPVGAIVQLVIAAWNVYTFLRDQLQRIWNVVRAVLDAVGDIARGILEPAAIKVESMLADLLVLAIDLLARLIGLGNVGAKVREVIESIQALIDRAIDRLIEGAVRLVGGGVPAAPGTPEAAAPEAAAAAATPADATAAAVDARDHVAVADQAVAQLQQVSTEGSFNTVRERVTARAGELRDYWRTRLEPGIGLSVVFPPSAEDQTDQDIDFEVVIAPNTSRKRGAVKPKAKPTIRLESGVLYIDEDSTQVEFNVGDPIQVKPREQWDFNPRYITQFTIDRIGQLEVIMVRFNTRPPGNAEARPATTYPSAWRKPIPELQDIARDLADEELTMERPRDYTFDNIVVARKVLNYRAHNRPDRNPPSKQWEHVAEQETGGPHSIDNLALADAKLNRRLGTYYGQPRTYNDLMILEDITEPIKLRDYMRGKPIPFQKTWKMKIYALPEFGVALRWVDQGNGEYQVLE